MNYKLITGIIFAMLLTGCGPEILMADDSGATVLGIADAVKANNQFAFDMYAKLNSGTNLFFSPWSLTSALTMTYEGAKGKTASEMMGVLHLTDTAERRPSIARIYNLLNKKEKNYILYTANALWAQESYAFLPAYTDLILRYYGGKVTNLDFMGNTESSRTTINNWVEDMTANKIKELLPPNTINGATRLVLTNAVYFKGDWMTRFTKSKTKEAPFKVAPTKTIKVEMMEHQKDETEFNYLEDNHLQILELPYKGEELSMLVLLPKDHDIAALEKKLTASQFAEWKNNLRKQNIKAYLPKFKLETTYSLVPVLKAMGMPTAVGMNADFSGMDGSNNLFISAVMHKAFVKVNEEGTEAAAATGVVMTMKAAMPGTVFRADHPFIFVIEEKSTGTILFLGKIVDPSS